ncbi:MAG: PAS domain S-box protein [Candidatus Omnitrophica bacterium]|nr:PAS domain S-box protein [Candidatus Omnitrophota bacterium]
MIDFFVSENDYIFFIYGLSFLILAGLCLALRKEEPYKLPWGWLGLFGVCQGIVKWSRILQIAFGWSGNTEAVYIIGLSVSFLFLFEFARRGMKTLRGRTQSLRIYLPFVALALLGCRYGLPGLNVTSCYFLGLPAGLYAFHVINSTANITRKELRLSLRLVGITLLLYMLTTGFFARHAIFPSDYLTVNYNAFMEVIGLPAGILRSLFNTVNLLPPAFGLHIQFIRMLIGLSLVAAVWLYSQNVHKAKLQPWAGFAKLQLSVWIMVTLVIIICLGWILTDHLDRYVRSELVKDDEITVSTLLRDVDNELRMTENATMAISTSPWVISALSSGRASDIDRMNRVLDIYKKVFRLSVCFVLDTRGVVVASSNRNTPESFVGNSYSFRPYFRDAMDESFGRYFAVGITTRERGYFAAVPSRNLQGRIVGVAVIKQGVEQLEESFKKYPHAFLVDKHGIIFLSSQPGLALNSIWPVNEKITRIIRASRQFGDGPFTPFLSTEVFDGEEVSIAGERFYVCRKPTHLKGWSIIFLSSMKLISQYRLFGISLALFSCLLVIIFFVVVRQRENLLDIVSVANSQRKAVLDAATQVAIIATDINGLVTVFNAGAERMLGHSADDIIGKDYTGIFHLAEEISGRERELTKEQGKDIKGFDIFSTYARQGRFEDHEWTYVRKDGSRIFVNLSATAQHDASGAVNGFVIIANDITQEKLAKDRIAENLAFLQTLIDAIPNPVFYKDTGGKYLGCNRAFEDYVGMSRHEIIGKITPDVTPKEIVDLATGADKTLFRKKEVQIYESPMVLKDGTSHDVIFYKAPLFDTKERLIGLVGTILDITERKRAETKIEELQKQIEFILGATKTGLDIIDTDYNMVYIDPEWKKVYGEYAGKKCYEYFMDRRNMCPGCGIPKAFKTKKITVSEEILVKEGNRPVQVTTIPFQDKNGKWFAAAVNVDITERKQAEEELRRARDELELRVQERTATLATTNRELEEEIAERKKVEEALRDSEQHLSDIINFLPDMTFAVDKDGKVIAWNQALESETGVRSEDMLGKDDYEYAIPFYRERRPVLIDVILRPDEGIEKKYDSFSRKEEYISAEVYLPTFKEGGAYLWARARPLYDAHGNIAGAIESMSDITARKRSEQKLAKINDCFVSFGPNPEENINRLTALCGELLGAAYTLYCRLEADRLISLGRWQTPPDFKFEDSAEGHICYDVIKDAMEDVVVVKNLPQTKYAGTDPNVLQYKLKSYVGKAIKVLGRSTGSLCILFQKDLAVTDEDKKVIGIISSAIGSEEERLHAEAALRDSEAHYRAVVQDQTELICRFLPDGTLTFVNGAYCRYFNKGYEELMGKSFIPLIEPEDRERVKRALASASQKSPIVMFEERAMKPDGHMAWLEWTNRAIYDDKGRLAEFQGVGRDITERKRTERRLSELVNELKRSNIDLEQFAYISSHDLQEPLRMVTSYMKLLERRYKGKLGDDADQFIDFAVDGATRMQKLINDLLAYSRVGTRGKEFVPTDCEGVLSQVMVNLQALIKEAGAVITHDHLPTVTADSSQLVQLLQNLVGNAIKFRSKKEPRIHIKAEKNENEWVFAVADNGIGIEEQYFERIFLIFQRLHTKEEYPGTGIGLAICKKIVERHGGRIWVESRFGAGSTFYFTLPAKGGPKGRA